MATEIMTLLTLAFILAGWVAFAEHPTARNLRRAIGRTLLA